MFKKTPLAPKSVGSKGEITLHQLAAVELSLCRTTLTHWVTGETPFESFIGGELMCVLVHQPSLQSDFWKRQPHHLRIFEKMAKREVRVR